MFYLLGLIILALSFHQVLWHAGAPYVFTRDDNFSQNLPLIQAQTQIYLDFQVPKMVWGLGAGWDPFSSGQMGIFYPIHFLAYGLSLVWGEPLLQMEFLFLLHQMALSIMVMLWAPGSDFRKSLIALCLMFVPASFLLGMVWWAYGCAHVWWIGAILFIHKEVAHGRPFQRHSSKLIFALLLFLNFTASHPQMFVWGGLLLCFWVFLSYPAAQRLRLFYILLLCSLPLLLALLYIKNLAMMTVGVSARSAGLILDFSQNLPTALVGALLGSWGGLPPMKIFINEYTEGPSLFFQPAIFVCFLLVVKQKKWASLVLIASCFTLLGAQSFPWLQDINLGPFNGFRWTFKLTVLFAPFFLLFLVLVLTQRSRVLLVNWFLAFLGLASLLICFEGRGFNLMTEVYGTQMHAGQMVEEAKVCLRDAKIPLKSRLAFVGDYLGPPQPVPAASLALTGNAALLLDVGATHLYEHLESAEMAEGHLYMHGRYGNRYDSLFVLNNRERIIENLRFIGATHMFTFDSSLLQHPLKTSCRNQEGHEIFFAPIPNSRGGTYPHPYGYDDLTTIQQHPNGELWVSGDAVKPPALNTSASISWIQEDDGWRGHPNPLNPLWGFSIAVLIFLSVLIFRRWP